jgi:hypothetical protein
MTGQITLSSASVRSIKRKSQARSIRTLLLTDDGPAVGTIWAQPFVGGPLGRLTMIVASIESPTASGGPTVRYEDGGWDWLDSFMDEVAAGRYVLIGVCCPAHSYVPTLFT